MVKKDAVDGAPHLNPQGRQNITYKWAKKAVHELGQNGLWTEEKSTGRTPHECRSAVHVKGCKGGLVKVPAKR